MRWWLIAAVALSGVGALGAEEEAGPLVPPDYVRIRMIGPNGQQVSRALVCYGPAKAAEAILVEDGPDGEVWQAVEELTYTNVLEDGSRVRRPKAPFQFTGWRPSDALGQRLPFGRAQVVSVAGDEREIILRFVPARTVSGVVRTASGDPVANAEVRALRAGMFGTAPWNEEYDVSRGETELALESVRSGGDGGFELTFVDSFPFWLRAIPRGPAAWSDAVLVAPSQQHVELVLPVSLAIRVVAEDQSPLCEAGVELAIVAPDPSGEGTTEQTISRTTDRDGFAYLPCPPHLISALKVSPPYELGDRLAAEETADWEPRSTVVSLLPGVQKRVRVTFPPDMRDHRDHISLYLCNDSASGYRWLGFLGADGSFDAPLLPVGSKLLALCEDGWRRSTSIGNVTGEAGALELRFPAADGELLLRAPGAVEGDIGWVGSEVGVCVRWFRFGAGGVAHVTDLPRGSYTAFVQAPRPGVKPSLRRGLKTAEPGESQESKLEPVASSVSIKFRIESVAGVEIVRPMVVGPGGSLLLAQQESDGMYVVTGVPVGRYQIRVYARRAGSTTPWFARAVAGPDETATLKLRPHHSFANSGWWGR